MHSVRIYTAAVIVAAVLASCATFGGDMPIRVEGSVPSQASGDSSDNCEISLVRDSDNKTTSTREDRRKFSTSFVVPAQSQSYYFTAKCGGEPKLRSQVFELGGKGTFNKLVNVGMMTPVE
jgi:hypothetical protein